MRAAMQRTPSARGRCCTWEQLLYKASKRPVIVAHTKLSEQHDQHGGTPYRHMHCDGGALLLCKVLSVLLSVWHRKHCTQHDLRMTD